MLVVQDPQAVLAPFELADFALEAAGLGCSCVGELRSWDLWGRLAGENRWRLVAGLAARHSGSLETGKPSIPCGFYGKLPFRTLERLAGAA